SSLPPSLPPSLFLSILSH
ncbi:kelch repeat, partial [Nannochloropsis oceanica]